MKFTFNLETPRLLLFSCSWTLASPEKKAQECINAQINFNFSFLAWSIRILTSRDHLCFLKELLKAVSGISCMPDKWMPRLHCFAWPPELAAQQQILSMQCKQETLSAFKCLLLLVFPQFISFAWCPVECEILLGSALHWQNCSSANQIPFNSETVVKNPPCNTETLARFPL